MKDHFGKKRKCSVINASMFVALMAGCYDKPKFRKVTCVDVMLFCPNKEGSLLLLLFYRNLYSTRIQLR